MKTRAFVQQLPKSPWLAESGNSVVSVCNFRVVGCFEFLSRPPDVARHAYDGSRTYRSRLEFAGIGGIIRR